MPRKLEMTDSGTDVISHFEKFFQDQLRKTSRKYMISLLAQQRKLLKILLCCSSAYVCVWSYVTGIEGLQWIRKLRNQERGRERKPK